MDKHWATNESLPNQNIKTLQLALSLPILGTVTWEMCSTTENYVLFNCTGYTNVIVQQNTNVLCDTIVNMPNIWRESIVHILFVTQENKYKRHFDLLNKWMDSMISEILEMTVNRLTLSQTSQVKSLSERHIQYGDEHSHVWMEGAR